MQQEVKLSKIVGHVTLDSIARAQAIRTLLVLVQLGSIEQVQQNHHFSMQHHLAHIQLKALLHQLTVHQAPTRQLGTVRLACLVLKALCVEMPAQLSWRCVQLAITVLLDSPHLRNVLLALSLIKLV